MSEFITRKRYALFLAAVLFPAAHAQFIQQGSKLVGSSAVGSPSQGSSVAVSADGNTALVGGYFDNAGAGAAWVWARSNGIWNQQGPKLVGAGAVGNAGQGDSVSISADGNTAIIGGATDNYNNVGVGAAWVWVRSNGVWSQQGPKLVGTGAAGNAGQGSSVAISGDGNTAIVGGPDDNQVPGGTIGAAWIFTRTNGVWTQQGPKLTATDAVGSAAQGISVAISADGNTAIVGGVGDRATIGAAWVYTRANGVWSQQGPKLVGAAVQPFNFGRSVALSGDGNMAVVSGGDLTGGPQANPTGATWVFTRTNGVWSQQGPKLTGAGAGGPVALSSDGSTLVTGAPGDNQGEGAVWVYTSASGVWSQFGPKLVGTGAVGTPPFSNPKQGTSVAISADGHTIIEGGPDDQPMGSAWVFVSASMYFVISAPASVTAGTPFSFTVTALDINNSIVSSYTGTVHFVANDPIGALAGDSTLINGVGTFTATLRTAGSFLITATDTVNSLITGNSAPIVVEGAAASSFAVSAPPSAISGVPFNFTVSAFDRFGNLTTSAVRFTSSDGAAILPAVSLMPAGVTTFAATLKTPGSQTIMVTDTGNSSTTGTSNPIVVTGNSPSFNLSQGKAATQSSTFPGYATDGASAAVDGNTDGNFGDGSVTATDFEVDPWWQVDLGFSATVNAIVIWNRTDCCSSRLGDYWIFISDTPFSPTDTPGTLQNRARTFASHQTAAPNPSTIIATAGAQGRYVRVQIENTIPTGPPGFPGGILPAVTIGGNILSLAEVQVFGTAGSSSGSNLAQGRPATQSSAFPGYPTDAAAAAVDGNTDGNFADGSVTATNADPNAWWQVDLGASATVNSVVIWNRTDCCSSRLIDYWVFISNTPFLPTDTPTTLENRAATFASHQTAAPSPAAAIAFSTAGASGRYVRVQLSGTDYLSLAEVQVFGTGGAPAGPTDVALGKPTTQSSSFPGYSGDGPLVAVDGNTDGNFFHGSVTATNLDPNPWWEVDLGASTAVSSIAIWNRTDCCGSRLNDFWVFVSDTPFLDTDTPTTLQSRPGTFASHQTAAPNPSATITGPAQGRYVRVQLSNAGFLSLAEVQVFGQ